MYTHYMVSISAIRVLLTALLIKRAQYIVKLTFKKLYLTHSVFHYTDKSLTDCHKSLPFNAMKTQKSVQNYAEFAMLLNACVIFYEIKKQSFKRYLSLVYASDT